MYHFGVLLSVICLATAAPFFDSSSSEEDTHHRHLWAPNYYRDGFFDTSKFWKNLEDELHQIDRYLTELNKQLPKISESERYEDGKYRIVYELQGYEEKEIKVSAKKQVLFIQAVHKSDNGDMNSVNVFRTLPDDVNPDGNWTYENGKLEIIFPLVVSKTTTVPITVEVSSTVAPVDREVIEESSQNEDIGNADVGLVDNEISNDIEATTYPVNLSNDVEFVPIKY